MRRVYMNGVPTVMLNGSSLDMFGSSHWAPWITLDEMKLLQAEVKKITPKKFQVESTVVSNTNIWIQKNRSTGEVLTWKNGEILDFETSISDVSETVLQNKKKEIERYILTFKNHPGYDKCDWLIKEVVEAILKNLSKNLRENYNPTLKLFKDLQDIVASNYPQVTLALTKPEMENFVRKISKHSRFSDLSSDIREYVGELEEELKNDLTVKANLNYAINLYKDILEIIASDKDDNSKKIMQELSQDEAETVQPIPTIEINPSKIEKTQKSEIASVKDVQPLVQAAPPTTSYAQIQNQTTTSETRPAKIAKGPQIGSISIQVGTVKGAEHLPPELQALIRQHQETIQKKMPSIPPQSAQAVRVQIGNQVEVDIKEITNFITKVRNHPLFSTFKAMDIRFIDLLDSLTQKDLCVQANFDKLLKVYREFQEIVDEFYPELAKDINSQPNKVTPIETNITLGAGNLRLFKNQYSAPDIHKIKQEINGYITAVEQHAKFNNDSPVNQLITEIKAHIQSDLNAQDNKAVQLYTKLKDIICKQYPEIEQKLNVSASVLG